MPKRRKESCCTRNKYVGTAALGCPQSAARQICKPSAQSWRLLFCTVIKHVGADAFVRPASAASTPGRMRPGLRVLFYLTNRHLCLVRPTPLPCPPILLPIVN